MRRDKVQELQGIDLFEISIVPSPANADTRVLSLKSNGDTCETCGQTVGRKSDPEPPTTAVLSDSGRSDTLPAPAGTGTSVAEKNDGEYWDDLRRESYRLATSVLLGE
jgi:hypothetical protein